MKTIAGAVVVSVVGWRLARGVLNGPGQSEVVSAPSTGGLVAERVSRRESVDRAPRARPEPSARAPQLAEPPAPLPDDRLVAGDLDRYLAQLEQRARQRGTVSVDDVEPGMRAIARLADELEPEEIERLQQRLAARMRRLEEELTGAPPDARDELRRATVDPASGDQELMRLNRIADSNNSKENE